MIIKIKNKKADMTHKVIIGLAITLIVLGVVLGFMHFFGFEEEIDKQACHQSVIYKATVPGDEIKNIVDLPLNCETEKICITSNWITKGNCDEDYLGEEYKTVRISKFDSKISGGVVSGEEGSASVSEIAHQRGMTTWDNEINEIIADVLSDCWWMMGQGLVQIYGRGASWEDKVECNICARIAFDQDLKKELEKLGGVKGTQKYLVEHTIYNSDKTYWQYLTNSNSNYIEGYEAENDVLTTSQKALVFLEVDKSKLPKYLVEGGATLGGAIIGSIVPVIGTAVGAGVGGAVGFFASEKVSEEVDKWYTDDNGVLTSLYLIDYNSTDLRNLECTSFRGKA